MTELTHPKLIALKEYMEAWINGNGQVIELDLSVMTDCLTPEETIRIFQLTGWLIGTSPAPWVPPKQLSFEEFYNSKMNKKPCGV